MSDGLLETKPKTTDEAEILLAKAKLKKPVGGLYMGLYYLMIILTLLVIGIGSNVAFINGMTGRGNFPLGVFYFGVAVALLCSALYFRTKAQQ